MKKLFEDKERKDMTPPTNQETSMEYFERYGSEEAEKRRQLLNSWFLNYPEAYQEKLRSDFRTHFSNALYEVFIHELFIKQGFKMEIHPNIPDSTNHPDFLASKDGIEFYVEATVASELTQDERAIENKTNVVNDAINRINSPYFLISLFEHRFKTGKQPNGKAIVSFFEKEISKYSVEEILENRKADSDDWIRVKFDNEDILITISLIPKPKELIGKKNIRPIGMHIGEVEFGGGPERSISNSIEKKAKRYGKLDKPLIVCVNTENSVAITEHAVFDILFGPLKFTWSTEPGNKDERMQRDWEGVFGNYQNHKIKRASGVFITDVNTGTMVSPEHWFFKHPFATHPLDFEILSLTHYKVENSKIYRVKKKTVKEILDII